MKNRKVMIALLLASSMAMAACGKKEAAQEAPEQPAVEEAAETEAAAEAEEAPAVEEEVQPEEPAFDPAPANKLFQINLPEDLAGKVDVEVSDDGISVYDKESKDAGFGGFAFAIQAFASPADYGYMNEKKIGELTAADGSVYDMAIVHPTDVQYDVVTYNGEAPENFASLYDSAEAIAETIQGMDGAVYAAGAGMKGEDLYGEILAKHIQAVEEEWDANKLEEEKMSPTYYAMGIMGDTDAMETIGYTYQDINSDGIDELLIGEIAEGAWQGVVYDIYTMVDREPAHVVSGWPRNRYYVLDGGLISNEFSGSAFESGVRIYALEHNSAELVHQLSFETNTMENEEQPWFVAYGPAAENEEWENVTEEEYNEIKSRFENLVRINYQPLSSAAGQAQEESSEMVGMANPWREVTQEEAQEACSQLFVIPEGAENVVFTMMEDAEAEGPLVQANFTLDGLDFVARAQNASEEHYIDGIGMYYDWTATEDEVLKGWGSGDLAAKSYTYVGDSENVDLYTWFDEKEGCGYSLSVVAENLDGFDLKAIVEQMKP